MSARGSSSSLVLAGRGSAPPPLVWRSWPLVEPTLAGALGVAAVVAAVVSAVVFTTGRWDWALAACGLVALAGWRLFVPVVYEASALGVTQQMFARRWRVPWQSIERAEVLRRGARLFFVDPAIGLGNGLYVPCPTHMTELRALLDYYLVGRVVAR
ncbi:MAG TPA: hypothetical protein VHZ24_03040 [Pirellulales bacterium]|jgi:hypothetical protein|nr:hypothetical protein [Pirellulales bacterium]